MTTATTQSSPSAAAAKRPVSMGAPPGLPMAAIDPMKLLQQYYPWLLASAVLGLVIGYAGYQVLKLVYPIWEADVTYEIRAVAEQSTDPLSGRGGNREDMEAFINTMARVARSDGILSQAIEDRAVRDTRWAQQFKDASGNIDAVAALKKLRKIVSTRAVPDTNIMQLTVGTFHKDDAPNIANAISLVFLDDTGTRSNTEMRALIQQFEAIVRDLGKDIEQIDARTEALMSKERLTSMRQESTVQYSEVENLQPALVRSREQWNLAKEQLRAYEEMLNNPAGPQFPEAIREEVERKPLVLERDATIAGLKAALRAQRETFGENHREVQLLIKRLNAEQTERDTLVNSQMTESFAAVIDNLRNSVRNQEASIVEMEERLRQARSSLESTTMAIKQYDDWTNERQQKVQKKAEMERNVNELRLLESRGGRIRVLANAQLPDTLAFPKLIPTVALGVFLCGGLAAGLIALKELREQRIRGPHDVALIPRTRVLGLVPDLSMDPSVPERVECASRDRPQGVISESVRQIRTNLVKEMMAKGLRSALIVSGLPGSGTSSLISNLAINAATAGLRVLVIDANLRRPRMHTILGASDAPGLADLLLGRATPDQAVQATPIAGVSLLPCGKRDVPVFERYTSPRMREVFTELKARYDLVLVDSTPGVVSGDAQAIASHCDAVVLVVRALSEKRGLVLRLRNQLGDCGAEFLGVVVNAVKPSAGGYFKRNFQVTHEYGREAEMAAERAKPGKGKDKEGGAGKDAPPSPPAPSAPPGSA
jgi:capsular exopolysaccharide synthesis family protein